MKLKIFLKLQKKIIQCNTKFKNFVYKGLKIR